MTADGIMLATVAVEVCDDEAKEGDLRFQHFSLDDSRPDPFPYSKSRLNEQKRLCALILGDYRRMLMPIYIIH